jgi:hypothetical protein
MKLATAIVIAALTLTACNESANAQGPATWGKRLHGYILGIGKPDKNSSQEDWEKYCYKIAEKIHPEASDTYLAICLTKKARELRSGIQLKCLEKSGLKSQTEFPIWPHLALCIMEQKNSNKQKHDLECLEKSFQYKIEQQAIVNFQRCSDNLLSKP